MTEGVESGTASAVRAAPAGADLPLIVLVHGSAELYGSDKVLLYLAGGIADAGEFQPVVALHEDGPLRVALEHAGVEVHVATVVKISRAMFSLSGLLALLRLARAAIVDLDRVVRGRRVACVHSNTLAVLGGAVWALRRGHRHLWHVHEIILEPKAMRQAFPWLVAQFAQRAVANSRPTLDWLVQQAPALRDRATVVYNGLPPPPGPDDAAAGAFRRAIGAADDDVVATVAGRLNHWKGQELAIAAIQRLRDQGRLGALRLAIVGSVYAGHENILVALQRQVREAGLEDRVSFLSFARDIYPIWRGSQIAIVPSTEPEPFGLVAIEAMACEKPVVAAAHGGLLDIVVDGETGLLFAPRDVDALADALARLTGDAALRRRLGQGGAHRQADVFSVATQIEQMLGIYRHMALR